MSDSRTYDAWTRSGHRAYRAPEPHQPPDGQHWSSKAAFAALMDDGLDTFERAAQPFVSALYEHFSRKLAEEDRANVVWMAPGCIGEEAPGSIKNRGSGGGWLAPEGAPKGSLRAAAKPACAGWEPARTQAAQAALAARRPGAAG
jgi:hypothetical protein